MTRLILIDADDGPEGGAATALGRLARQARIAHEVLAFEAVASGLIELKEAAEIHLVDLDSLAARLARRGEDEIVVPCSRRALTALASLAAEGRLEDAGLRAMLGDDRPWLRPETDEDADEDEEGQKRLAGLLATRRCRLEAPDLRRALDELGPGFLIGPRERLVAVADAEDAWYRLRGLERAGDWPAAFFPARGAALYAASGWVVHGQSLAHGVLRLDAARESWRPAMGRSVAGRTWEAAIDELAAAVAHDGFIESMWLQDDGARRPRLVAWRPLPAAWIDLLGDQLVAALAGEATGLLRPGLVQVDAPVDRALGPEDLAQWSLGR